MADGSLIFDTKLDTSGLSSGLSSIGSMASTAFKSVAVAVGGAATAVGVLAKSALDGYANYEQLTGGVETLFKTSSDVVMGYAENAYKTSGMSANQYMETVTGFSASLIQSLDNDTARAASIADMAITDMSDNANKMGTSIDMIQNAYNGFAKGNFTMLDNLKLGYGGTQEEMKRLLADAEKISGIKYDISSFSDVAQAIHVIQNEIGIAGATAAEASSTIEGSVNSMKAAWSNLVVGLADDNADLNGLINQFVDSVMVAGENIIPRIEIILGGIGQLIQSILPMIVDALPGIIDSVLPQLLEAGIALVNAIITGVTGNLDSLLGLASDIIMQLVDVIITNLPLLIEAGLQIIVQLALGIAEALPTLIPTIVSTIILIVETLINNIGMLVDAAIAIMIALAEGLIAALPQLIEKAPEILISLVNAIIENAPKLLEAGLQLIVTLAEALITNIPKLIAKVPEIVLALVNAFVSLVSRLYEVGSKFVITIRDAITNKWSELVGKVSGWVDSLKSKFTSMVSNFSNIGSDIVSGIWNGISSGWNWLKDKVSSLASGLLDAAKNVLGIKSPSKKFKYIGEMCVAGFDEGFEDFTSGDAIARGVNASLGTVGANTSSARSSLASGFNQTINVNKEISTPDELARTIRLESRYGLMRGVAFV